MACRTQLALGHWRSRKRRLIQILVLECCMWILRLFLCNIGQLRLIRGEKTEKAAFLPSTQPTKNHLKRQSLNHQYKELSRTHQDTVDVPIELLTDPAWKPDREADIEMFLSVPGITSKEQLPGEIRKLTLALIAHRFPHTAWTLVCTDGSA